MFSSLHVSRSQQQQKKNGGRGLITEVTGGLVRIEQQHFLEAPQPRVAQLFCQHRGSFTRSPISNGGEKKPKNMNVPRVSHLPPPLPSAFTTPT